MAKEIVEIPTERLLPNPYQPRKQFSSEEMLGLADSIQQNGVLQPLLARRINNSDYYELIAGERRWRAAKLAGFREVPVIVREYTRQQTMEIALIENVQRADLNPIEEAKAYQMLIQEFGLRQEDVAERVAKNRATITNSMRLLKLDERVQEMLIQDRLTGGHARALLSLEDGEKQYQLALKSRKSFERPRGRASGERAFEAEKGEKESRAGTRYGGLFQGCGREAERSYGNEGFDQPQG